MDSSQKTLIPLQKERYTHHTVKEPCFLAEMTGTCLVFTTKIDTWSLDHAIGIVLSLNILFFLWCGLIRHEVVVKCQFCSLISINTYQQISSSTAFSSFLSCPVKTLACMPKPLIFVTGYKNIWMYFLSFRKIVHFAFLVILINSNSTSFLSSAVPGIDFIDK